MTDVNGTSATQEIYVGQPNVPLQITVTPGAFDCATGMSSVTVEAIGGLPPYTGTGTFTGQTSGTKTYTVTDFNNCTASKTIEVSGNIGDRSADMTGPTNVVAGSINTYSLPAIPGASYSWVADGGQVVGGWNTRTISVKAGAINGYVRATLKNACGTAPVAKKYFFVQGATNCPSPDTIIGKTNNLCGAKTVSYTAAGAPGVTSYQWIIPGGFSLIAGQGTATITIKSPASFTTAQLSVKAITPCGTSKERILILSGLPADLSAVITGPSQVISGTTNIYSVPADAGLRYSWVADGGAVVGGWGSPNANIKAGIINGYVKLTLSNACGTGPLSRKYFTSQPAAGSSVAALKLNGSELFVYNVYPNPVRDRATIEFSAAETGKQFKVKMYDVHGRLLVVETGKTVQGLNMISFPTVNIAKGIYMIILQTADKSYTRKLFKSN